MKWNTFLKFVNISFLVALSSLLALYCTIFISPKPKTSISKWDSSPGLPCSRGIPFPQSTRDPLIIIKFKVVKPIEQFFSRRRRSSTHNIFISFLSSIFSISNIKSTNFPFYKINKHSLYYFHT